jgi:hexosaminidase
MSEPLFRKANPIVPVRGVHLDLKGCPPTPQRLVSLLPVVAAARYNAVLVEWEDMFPWTVDERFRGPDAYTLDDVRRFAAAATERGIEIIPLVQCLGHMETPLGVPEYERLREVPHDAFVLNALADGAHELVQRMVDEVAAALPGLRHFHLGGDEAASMGTHPDTRAYVEKHGKGALYLQHVEPILDSLNARGIRPILWHDMMVEWDDAALDALAAKADLLTWGYGDPPETTGAHYGMKHIERFHDHGITLWGGAAYKGANGHNVDRPDLESRQRNALGWARVAERFEYAGIVATAWSRYSTHMVQCEPIDAALDSLVNVGVILHDGEVPTGGIDACLDALRAIGERERFEACRDAMAELSAARAAAWRDVQNLREQVWLSGADPRRRGSDPTFHYVRSLRGGVARVAAAGEAASSAFDGLMAPCALAEYVGSRLEPLRQEAEALEAEVRTFDPDGYAAITG